jgi:protein arginine kinase activator
MLKELVVINGKKIERQLCEQCVRAQAAQQPGLPGSGKPTVQQLLTQLMVNAGINAMPAALATQPSCPRCGLRFAQFRERGLLGCSECYRAFEADLQPLIERAHEGGCQHTGKVPRRANESQNTLQRIVALRQLLNQAVQAEEYEKAAVLRDELLHLERSLNGGVPGA